MRTALWTVFLIVALQGIASASTASASTDTPPAASSSAAEVPSPTARSVSAAQPSLRPESQHKADQNQAQVLTKNFQSPKPVQIYWFFGGR